MTERSNLGRFIRECRLNLGYTSRKIEELTHSRQGLARISHSNLIAIEKGKHIPTYDKIVTLSQVFSVPTQLFEDQLKLDMAGPTTIPEGTTFESAEALGKEYLSMGDVEQALECFTQCYTIAEQLDLPEKKKINMIAEARLHVANCQRRLGLPRVARDELEQILTLDDLDEEIEARVFFVLAAVYRQLRNFRVAERHINVAMEIAGTLERPELSAKVFNTAANIALQRGQRERAESLYRKAMAMFKRTGQEAEIGRIQRNLGVSFIDKGEYTEAARLLEDGIGLARKHNNRHGIASGLCSLAAAHFHMRKLQTARKHAKEAKEIAQESGYSDCLFISLYYLWMIAQNEKQKKLEDLYFDRLKVLTKRIDFELQEVQQFRRHLDGVKEARK